MCSLRKSLYKIKIDFLFSFLLSYSTILIINAFFLLFIYVGVRFIEPVITGAINHAPTFIN